MSRFQVWNSFTVYIATLHNKFSHLPKDAYKVEAGRDMLCVVMASLYLMDAMSVCLPLERTTVQINHSEK